MSNKKIIAVMGATGSQQEPHSLGVGIHRGLP